MAIAGRVIQFDSRGRLDALKLEATLLKPGTRSSSVTCINGYLPVNLLIWTHEMIKLSRVSRLVLESYLVNKFCTKVGVKR